MSVIESGRVVRARRAVSVRDLARKAGALIDEIQLDGGVLVVSRHGKMVAAITPLPERTLVEFVGAGLGSAVYEAAELPEVRPEWGALGDAERALLRRGGEAYPMPFGVEGIPFPAREVSVALGRLELDGLIERILGGRKLTREGHAAAAWLDSCDDARAEEGT